LTLSVASSSWQLSCAFKPQRNYKEQDSMSLYILGFTALAFVSFTNIGMGPVDQTPVAMIASVHIVTVNPGVVPRGTTLLVRTNETVSTDRAFRSEIYDAQIAEGVQDQNGNLLIPSMSPVELAVNRVEFLGPGGVGMSELILDVRTITVEGVRYEVETAEGTSKGAGFEPRGALAITAEGRAHHVHTSGRRINVPMGTVLKFQTKEPIRLRGHDRSADCSGTWTIALFRKRKSLLRLR
jgi:hypothetical protein